MGTLIISYYYHIHVYRYARAYYNIYNIMCNIHHDVVYIIKVLHARGSLKEIKLSGPRGAYTYTYTARGRETAGWHENKNKKNTEE